MEFKATAESYDRTVGRYSRELAPRFCAFAGVDALPKGQVLDVGCGSGALTAWLAQRVGAASVTGVDPTPQFAAVCRERVPGADVRVAAAESLPFRDRTFQAALAQLVLTFASDGPRAAAEMARVVRPGGVVAACTFEANGFAPARVFWEAARRLDPGARDDSGMPLRTADALADLFRGAGLREVRTGTIALDVDWDRFDELAGLWEGGVGPTGAYFAAQPEERRRAIREACFELLGRPRAGFSLPALVVAAAGRT